MGTQRQTAAEVQANLHELLDGSLRNVMTVHSLIFSLAF